MIAILGRRRMTVLLSLLTTCLLLCGFYLGLLLPQVSAYDRTLRNIRGDVAGMEEQTRNLKAAYEEFHTNKSDYDRVKSIGFFNTQERLQIRDRFMNMKEESGVLNVKYEFSPAVLVRNQPLQDAGYRMLQSDLFITLEAVDDITLYKFLYSLINEFPGRISIVDMNILREDKGLDTGLYKQILSGPMPVLVVTNIRAQWQSVVSAAEINGLIEDVAPPEDIFQ